MESEPKIVVLVPAYNEEEQIAATIESLLAQTLVPSKIVIIANNCTDRTAEIARKYPVSVVDMPNNPHRKSGAMNYGWLLYAKDVDFVCTMDADTVMQTDTLEKLADELQSKRSLAAVCARYWAQPGKGIAWQLQRLEYARYDDTREIRGWKVNVASGAASLYSADALVQVVNAFDRPEGPWDNTSLIEDYALTLDLKTLGWKVSAARDAHVLTDTPKTFRSLWVQRLRWGRGGMDECRKRGWTLTTFPDILAYWFFGLSISMRLAWVILMTMMLVLNVPITFSLLGLIPVVVMWLDRVTSAWRLPGRTRKDTAVVCSLLIEDMYGFFLELCALASLWKSLFSRRQTW